MPLVRAAREGGVAVSHLRDHDTIKRVGAGARYHCRNAGEKTRQALEYVRHLIAIGSPRVSPELRAAVESGDLGRQIDALRAFGADDACWPAAPAKAVDVMSTVIANAERAAGRPLSPAERRVALQDHENARKLARAALDATRTDYVVAPALSGRHACDEGEQCGNCGACRADADTLARQATDGGQWRVDQEAARTLHAWRAAWLLRQAVDVVDAGDERGAA